MVPCDLAQGDKLRISLFGRVYCDMRLPYLVCWLNFLAVLSSIGPSLKSFFLFFSRYDCSAVFNAVHSTFTLPTISGHLLYLSFSEFCDTLRHSTFDLSTATSSSSTSVFHFQASNHLNHLLHTDFASSPGCAPHCVTR